MGFDAYWTLVYKRYKQKHVLNFWGNKTPDGFIIHAFLFIESCHNDWTLHFRR